MQISKYGELTENRIIDFENTLGHTLPEEYRIFLKKYNGGDTPNTRFSANGVTMDIQWFYGLDYVPHPIEGENIILEEKDTLLIFAEDSFGNVYTLSMNDGKVSFIDHETNKRNNIAEDFLSFVNSCISEDINPYSLKSVEEREKDLKARGKNVSDDLRELWKAEYEKFSNMKLETVVID